MAKYINADEIYHDMTVKNVELHEKDESWREFRRGFAFALEFVKNAPDVDVRENIHGEWNLYEINEDHEYEWFCSECDGRNDVKTAFCPNCGADMRGKRK